MFWAGAVEQDFNLERVDSERETSTVIWMRRVQDKSNQYDVNMALSIPQSNIWAKYRLSGPIFCDRLDSWPLRRLTLLRGLALPLRPQR